MTNKLREELIRVEAALQAAKQILARQEYVITDQQAQLRIPLVISLIDQAIEHHEAMLLLITRDMTGSAFALARSVVEGVYRGLWINQGATHEEIQRFTQKDEISISMGKLSEVIDASNNTETFFADLKKRSWDVLNSYTHNGMMQLSRRFTGTDLQPAYTDGQISEIMTIVTTRILLLIMSFLGLRGHANERAEVEALLKSLCLS
ncbi:MAG TPA: hypothetical protein VG892_12745 [Terriglobales bacterium]|jgi:hypothetical protein|nr:hypothetical protein [Terriglobales bacterium]